MKLSKQEELYILEMAQLPRLKRTHILLLLGQYGFPNLLDHHIHQVSNSHRAFCSLVEEFVENPTLDLDACITRIATHYEITPTEILTCINKCSKSNTSLDAYSIKSPTMIVQRLAYLCSWSTAITGKKLSLTLKITTNNRLFFPMLETIHLLSICPNLKKKKLSLAKILSYRLGISVEDILQLFNISFDNESFLTKSKYIQNLKDKSFLGCCAMLAKRNLSIFCLG